MQPGISAEILATNLRVLAALHRVLDLLVGLPVVVFKGPISTQGAFGHLGARASADNDLWLPLPAAETALSRLLAAGYLPSPHVDPVLALRTRGQVALWPAGDGSQVSVDLHARPFARPYFEVDEQLLLQHLANDASTGRIIKTFDPDLAFCHAVAHYVQHHFPDDHLELIARLWLVSMGLVAEVAGGTVDLDRSLPELVDGTCGRAAAELALRRAAELGRLASTTRPTERRAREVARVLSHFHGAPPGVIRKFLALYLTAPERLLAGIWHSAFPRNDVLHERYGMGPRPALLLRHLLRVLRER